MGYNNVDSSAYLRPLREDPHRGIHRHHGPQSRLPLGHRIPLRDLHLLLGSPRLRLAHHAGAASFSSLYCLLREQQNARAASKETSGNVKSNEGREEWDTTKSGIERETRRKGVELGFRVLGGQFLGFSFLASPPPYLASPTVHSMSLPTLKWMKSKCNNVKLHAIPFLEMVLLEFLFGVSISISNGQIIERAGWHCWIQARFLSIQHKHLTPNRCMSDSFATNLAWSHSLSQLVCVTIRKYAMQ